MNKFLLFILAVSLIACENSKKKQSEVHLAGAGATFPLPYYNLAFKTYQDTAGISVTYGGIGSGGGIRSLKDKIVDFSGTDAFLSDREISEMPATVIHIPTCLGAVVLAYNLPGIEKLNLTGKIIANIYLGKILRWNDEQIKAINPEVNLPDQNIQVVYRSDGSGTTYTFSDYLSKVCETWKQDIGSGKALKWPAGIAAKGNPGVAGTISQTPGSIGYIGSEYAFTLNLPTAAIQNQAGNYILPTTTSIAAAANVGISADTRTMITNSPAPEAYPISCFTWLLIYQEQAYSDRSAAQATATVELLNWLISPQAQKMTTKVHYTPLPEKAVLQAQELLKTVTYEGKSLIR